MAAALLLEMSDSNIQCASKDKCTTIYLFMIELRRRMAKLPGVGNFERPVIIYVGLTKQESRSPIIPLDLIGEGEETSEAAIVKAEKYHYERHCPKQGTSNGEATVVLLNGLFGGGMDLDSAWKALTEDNDYDVVRFPDSFALRHDHRFSRCMCMWLIDFLDTTQIRHPILCGNSLGGLIVLDFAAAYPDRVDAVVSSGSPGMTRRGLMDPAGDFSMSMLNNPDLIAERVFYNPEVLTPEYHQTGAYADIRSPKRFRASLRALRLVQEYDATGIPAEIRCPVLLIWGITIGSLRLRTGFRTWEKLKNHELVQIETVVTRHSWKNRRSSTASCLTSSSGRDAMGRSQRPDSESNADFRGRENNQSSDDCRGQR